MLDLKAKLLAAGVVTADQVKKVEDEQAARQAREKERREAERRRREEGPPPRDRDARDDRGPRPDRGDRPRGPRPDRGDRPRGPGGPGGGDRPRGPRPPREPRPAPVDGPPVDGAPQGAPVDGAAVEGARPPRAGRPRDTRSFKERRAEENLEKRARREHEWTESLRWRGRLDALLAAGKSEQYEAVRGWVMKLRLDNTQISEAAQRYFFTTYAGTLSHLTVEPDVHQQLVDGSAGIVAFIGYNGQEHAVVPKDVAVDIRAIKPEWLRHLIGITDIEPPLVKPPAPEASAAAAESTATAEGAEGAAPSDADAAVVTVDEGARADDGEGGSAADAAVEATPPTEPEAG